MVVQMAKAVDARVITTGGSDEKVARCRELGADLAINYRTEDVDAAIRQFAPGGVDVFWETLREPDFDKIVGCLAERGRIVLMAGRRCASRVPGRTLLRQELLDVRRGHVQGDGRRAAELRRRNQSLVRRRQAAAADRRHPAAVRSRRRTSAAGRKHAGQAREPGRKNRTAKSAEASERLRQLIRAPRDRHPLGVDRLTVLVDHSDGDKASADTRCGEPIGTICALLLAVRELRASRQASPLTLDGGWASIRLWWTSVMSGHESCISSK